MAVGATVAVAAASRLPLLRLPAWPDEAGFLQVAAGWHLGGGGPYVYGPHWVDRPPGLITLYALADALGGLTALRVVGAVAAGITVLAVADLAGTLSPGPASARARTWAAVCAAALLSTPWHWSFMVDGELLAAPYVAAGMSLAARGLAGTGRRHLAAGAGGGALAAMALLTKQNFADVFVFVAVLGGLRLLGRSPGRRHALRVLLAFAAGSLAAVGAVAAWTAAHGTSLSSVWYAMYAFRLDAVRVHALAPATGRLATLAWASLLSGLAIVLVAGLVGAALRGRRDPGVLALLAVLAFDAISVLAGGDYWLHYLLQPSVAAAALLGVLVGRGVELRPVALVCAALAAVGVAGLLVSAPATAEEQVGRAVRSVALPHDALVTVPGHSNVNLAAGLSSPYPYLWGLPARTLDHDGRKLRAVLRGPDRPAWFVLWHPLGPSRAPESLAGTVRAGYRPVARVCGRTIWLRDDLSRPVPWAVPRPDATRASRCRSAAGLPPLLRHLP